MVGLLGGFVELTGCQGALSAGGGAVAAVIVGPPGIGKTSLWRGVAESQPAGTVVLRTTGVASRRAGFANLADLLDPVAERVLPRLPEPQADVLRVVLGRAVASGPFTETLLERAVVGALGGLAGAGVVVAVDDEQWLDEDTRRLLETVAVRLNGAPVWWLVTVRSGHADRGLAQVLARELADRAARVELSGLDDAVLTELVLRRFPGQWSPAVLRRVVALAAGSPYAAVELARETAAHGGRDGAAVDVPSTPAGSLPRRLGGLGSPTLAVGHAS